VPQDDTTHTVAPVGTDYSFSGTACHAWSLEISARPTYYGCKGKTS